MLPREGAIAPGADLKDGGCQHGDVRQFLTERKRDPVQTRAWNGQSFSFSLHIHNRADLIQRSDDYLLTLGLDKPNNDGILPDSCAKENIS
jgi:hypothetical protein